MKIVGYSRVSTARQAAESCSLQAQQGKIEVFATANGHELVALEVGHGLSGKSMAGPPSRTPWR